MNKNSFILFTLLILFSCFICDNVLASNYDITVEDTVTDFMYSEPIIEEHELPQLFMVIPFVTLLLMIATGPIMYPHFWEHHYPKVAVGIGSVTALYYLAVLNDYHSLLHSLAEYLSFIALLGSLFIASGGIFLRVDKKATPLVNVLRPYIIMNKDRIRAYHIIFFIFLVSNIGGALTPIGDPPLFLGFLRGVPFFWVIANVWFIWLLPISILLTVFYIFDSTNKSGQDGKEKIFSGMIKFKGWRNVFYLAVIIVSVFLDPAVLSWVPSLSPLPFGIREIIMFSVMFISYKRADQRILKINEFDFEPIKEVAYLFIGIFIAMIPALQLIGYQAQIHADKLTAGVFYWATGSLSGFLDNAPTYLNFLSAALGKEGLDVNVKSDVLKFVSQDVIYLRAISVAAVFFGAMTYIGNGPNFMVKSICERAGIKMPSFFTYMVKYSIPILIPIFILVWAIFFR
jgi:Na+/H+ antiporter NhaD/arsenite permease-like protein